MQDKIKVYVEVIVDFDEAGKMIPKEIVWEDGSHYEIDKVKQVCQAAARKAGGQGDRYTIMVMGQETYLYFERNASMTGDNIGRWFVERRAA